MREKRVPSRVHVVRPPQDDQQANSRNLEIVRMLAQISDKLKRSEAERYELLGELREYRKSLKELEEKADYSKKSVVALENKMQSRDQLEAEVFARQARFEKSLKETEEKIVKSAANQAILNKKIIETEEKQTGIDQRLDESITEQTRLSRQVEMTGQDKSRIMRKVERLEEIVLETQDALRAKAMVLLTDQSNAAQAALSAPAYGQMRGADGAMIDGESMPWIARVLNFKTLGVTSMVVAAMLSGWAINQVQQPQMPQIAILEGGGMARLNLDEQRWEPLVINNKAVPSNTVSDLAALESQKMSSSLTGSDMQVTPATLGGEMGSVSDYSDEQLLEALEKNPEELAAQLNAIEPGATNPAAQAISLSDEPTVTTPVANFDKMAFAQDPKIANQIAASKSTDSLSSRMQPDASLPNVIRDIETKAFDGVPEAQHDLAAIYTAGHGGVKQNFDKAAFWFREASDAGIANAQYNLGVLHHQGLGVNKDLDIAMYWYREAAKNGHPEAQYNLGIAYIEGIGTEYNPQLAAAFFERAANNGIMEAAYNLGLIYENGLLGQAKPDEAFLWYKIASDQGSPDAKEAMAQLAKAVQIDMQDVDKLVERMQEINEAAKGRRAGPLGKAKTSNASQIAPSAGGGGVNEEQALVAQVQEYLMLTNYYPGPADGITGPQTVDAISAYQSANNLPVTGQASKKLLAHMVSGAIKTLNR
ncbi:MAG: hypothetical protein GW903_00220 [Alphaproteobacteria bacterium]|nr:hypothetical protein [Alphaproteobacteria bacterium]NCQ87395.1 hypothetical protein [Alphaproteobacteria bacterium]NCT06266.1 hypothetical protein [Alphaproteobacteria bacterium]